LADLKSDIDRISFTTNDIVTDGAVNVRRSRSYA